MPVCHQSASESVQSAKIPTMRKEPFGNTFYDHIAVQIKNVPTCSNHVMGLKCLIKWLVSPKDSHNSCPICRGKLYWCHELDDNVEMGRKLSEILIARQSGDYGTAFECLWRALMSCLEKRICLLQCFSLKIFFCEELRDNTVQSSLWTVAIQAVTTRSAPRMNKNQKQIKLYDHFASLISMKSCIIY
jgi:hypothetical protein